MGTVQDVGEDYLAVEVSLPGFSRHHDPVSREIVLQVVGDTVVFSQDLAVITPAELAIDSTITAAARSVWGSPVAKLLYDGTIHDLSEHSYRGRLVEDQGGQLLLEAPWGEELTIVLDDATIWMDGGSMEPPTELQVGLPLQVLGTMQDDGTVLAALVTSGTMY